jgi:type IX secretion system PorP/SprF family membrane protein
VLWKYFIYFTFQIIIATHKVHKAIKKYSLLFLISLIGTLNAFSQQEPRYTLYMQNISLYNSGYVGSKSQGDAVLYAKQPYGTFKDAAGNSIGTNDFGGTFNMPLKKINSGLGINWNIEQNGLFESSKNIALQYAYQLKIGDGKLGLGASFGMNTLGFDFSKAIYSSSLQSGTGGSDDLIQKIPKSKTIFNLGLGAFYTKGDLYFGASFTNINSPKLKLNQGTLKYFMPNVYFIAGYTYKPTNPLFVIMPSMQYKTPINGILTITSPQLSLNTIVEYSRFLLMGMEYTTGSNLSIIAGANIKNGSKFDGARFLFAYDFMASKLGALNPMKFEFLLGYSFNLHIEKNTKTYKSVRFL